AMNFKASRLPARLAMLHTSLLAPRCSSYRDLDLVSVHSLAPSATERLRMSPMAIQLLPPLQRYAYHATNRFSYRIYRAVYRSRLRRLMQEMRADVLHSLAGGFLGWTAQQAASDLGVPFVCTPFVHPRQWGDGPQDIAYYRRSQAVIGLVKTDADYLASIG